PPELMERLATASSYAGDHEESYRGQRLAILPIDDASGQRVGEAVLLRDVSGHLRNNLLAIAQVIGVGLLGSMVLFGFGYRLLGRTEATMTQEQVALEESEQRYRALFERGANPVLVLDTEGNYLNANPAALAFLECSREALLGKNVRDFIPEDASVESVLAEHRPLWEQGGVIETRYAINGAIKILQLAITSMTLDGRNVVVGIGRDVTQERASEAKLREQLEELREFQRLTVGRELRMEEIEQENAALKARIDELEKR
ncbi:MAG: PAS domain S-box protein, partial [Gammaproteobacteria bacterium]|nr:PAS domain S-box protein [Gammaproteobacteria bacterium]